MNLAADELSCMPTCLVALCDGVTLIYRYITKTSTHVTLIFHKGPSSEARGHIILINIPLRKLENLSKKRSDTVKARGTRNEERELELERMAGTGS